MMPPFLRSCNDYENRTGSLRWLKHFVSTKGPVHPLFRSFTLQSEFPNRPCQVAMSYMVCARGMARHD
jgi:hypothetical protein